MAQRAVITIHYARETGMGIGYIAEPKFDRRLRICLQVLKILAAENSGTRKFLIDPCWLASGRACAGLWSYSVSGRCPLLDDQLFAN